MLLKSIMTRAEIAFWDRMIPLMSESPFVQNGIRQVYGFFHETNLSLIPVIVLGSAFAGLVSGYFLGVLGIALW